MEQAVHEYLINMPMGPLAVVLLVGAAMLEYVFPPFPGDTAVLAGAFLVATANWNPLAVVLAVNAGSIGGLMMDYYFGLYVRHHDARWRERSPKWRKLSDSIHKVMPLFEKHPEFYLVINRFLPSVRAFFFVAAGMAEVPLWKVVALGGVSAVVWCLLLFGVGWWVGNDWDRLVAVFSSYQKLAWVVVAVVVIFLVRKLIRNANGGA